MLYSNDGSAPAPTGSLGKQKVVIGHFARSSLLKLTLLLLLAALMIIPGTVFGAKIYSVQAGTFQKIENAENQCQALRKMIEPAHLEALRIEKKGPNYAVRIGQFNQEKPARHLLSRIKKAFPQAFLWRELSPKGRDTTREGKISFLESPLEIRRAILWGTVLESSPLTGNPLGLVPEKEISRVMVRVDKSEAVKGYPNFLQDKETEEIILFSEIRQPFFIPAQRIKALVEYQGDKHKRFFWIKQAEPIKP
jgi:hypothetical protein